MARAGEADVSVSLRFRLTRLMERIALGLRGAGLGSLVDWTRDRFLTLLGPFELQVGAARLSGATIPHLAYLRELEAGREGYTASLFESACAPGREVLDLGAHLGYMTQLAAARGAHVWAFEPNPETRPLLERGLRRSRLGDRVTVLPYALSDADETRRLFVSGGGDTASLYEHGEADESLVTCRRGDDVFGEDLSLDVVKLDVEGAEVAALSGMAETLRRASAHLTVITECNPEALRRAGATPEALVGLLRSHGLEVYACDERARALIPWDDFQLDGEYANLYAVRGEEA
jgi:FkbM family methyltransferase